MTRRYLISTGMIMLAVWLLNDVNTFSLYPGDSAIGREYGCYTALEIWMGIKAPSWIRGAEFIAAFLMMLISFWIVFVSFKNYLKRRKDKVC